MSFHREENIDKTNNLKKISESIIELSKKYMMPIIISTHPRTKKRIDDLKINFPEKVKFCRPFKFSDYKLHKFFRSK